MKMEVALLQQKWNVREFIKVMARTVIRIHVHHRVQALVVLMVFVVFTAQLIALGLAATIKVTTQIAILIRAILEHAAIASAANIPERLICV